MGEASNYFDYKMRGSDCLHILNAMPRLVKLVDLEGNILFWNEGGAEVFGYTPEEMMGKKVWTLYPERVEETFVQELNLLKTGGDIHEQFKGIHKDGSTIWLDVRRKMFEDENGRQIILGTASDITAEIEAKKELSRSKKRLQEILDNAVEGIITIDIHANIESFNKAAEEIFGYSQEEVLGENIKILMPPPYSEEHNDYMKNYLETGERKIIGIGREVRGKRKNGEVFPMTLSVSEIKVNGNIIFTGIIRDVSEQRRLENEILQISEEERRKIGQELHDGLGQMLTGIGLIAQNLANKLKSNELPGAEDVQEIADMVHEADQQARSLSHGLVHMEIEQEGLSIALQQLCRRAKRLFNIDCHLDIDTTIESEIEIKDKVAVLHLYRIVQEAISNAVKHGYATKVRVELFSNNRYLQLKVIDNGIGFSSTNNKKEEKGIGLNTMIYRANLLGGNIDIDQTSEGHTIIDCRIPLNEF